MKIRRKPELLIPASSLEVLKVAVLFGADAVYIGGEVFGLRAKAKNFTMEEMAEGIRFAHEHGFPAHFHKPEDTLLAWILPSLHISSGRDGCRHLCLHPVR